MTEMEMNKKLANRKNTYLGAIVEGLSKDIETELYYASLDMLQESIDRYNVNLDNLTHKEIVFVIESTLSKIPDKLNEMTATVFWIHNIPLLRKSIF